MAASAAPAASASPPPDDALVVVDGLKKYFATHRGMLRRETGTVKAVDDVSFVIRSGETFGLVGESGSGKSTVARLILRAYEPTGGTISFRRADGSRQDITHLTRAALRPLRREMQMIFQDPYASLNPRMTVAELVAEPLKIHGVAEGREADERVAQLLRQVGLPPEVMVRYPHAFSGGQRQRISIARALSLNPSFIAADEAVSALDVSIAAQTINLLQDLQERLSLTYLFITHDLSMVKHISDRVGVMYAGRLVEIAETGTFFARPRHPYTETLLAAIPTPDPRRARSHKHRPIIGEVADPTNLPPGCAFAPRCRFATDLCRTERPALRALPDGHNVSCHHAEDLVLEGVGS